MAHSTPAARRAAAARLAAAHPAPAMASSAAAAPARRECAAGRQAPRRRRGRAPRRCTRASCEPPTPWLPLGAALPPGGAARGALERQQARFAREYALARGGALRVAPLEAAQEAVATELLTDSFADALGYSTPRPVRRAYIREYLRSQRAWPPDGICLVGVYEDAATGEESIAATMTLSFTSETREDFTSLAPPEGSVYLCNMCTLRSLQRRGCAKAMLAAAGDFVEQMGCDEIWLHARLSDEKSVALYEGDGFKGVQTDGEQTFWDKMVTRGRDTRRVLMRKAA